MCYLQPVKSAAELASKPNLISFFSGGGLAKSLAAEPNFSRLAAGSYFGACRYTSRRRSIKERRSKNTLEKVVYSDARSARDTGTVLGEEADYIYQCGDTLRTHVGITSTSNKCQKLRVINMGVCLANVVLCPPPGSSLEPPLSRMTGRRKLRWWSIRWDYWLYWFAARAAGGRLFTVERRRSDRRVRHGISLQARAAIDDGRPGCVRRLCIT